MPMKKRYKVMITATATIAGVYIGIPAILKLLDNYLKKNPSAEEKLEQKLEQLEKCYNENKRLSRKKKVRDKYERALKMVLNGDVYARHYKDAQRYYVKQTIRGMEQLLKYGKCRMEYLCIISPFKAIPDEFRTLDKDEEFTDWDMIGDWHPPYRSKTADKYGRLYLELKEKASVTLKG